MITGMMLGAAAAPAQEEEGESLGDLATQETASMREATYKELAKAQEAADAERYSEAIQILDKLGNLRELDYPRDRLEIIFADGASSDDTAQLLDATVEAELGERVLGSDHAFDMEVRVGTADGRELRMRFDPDPQGGFPREPPDQVQPDRAAG